MVSKQNGPDDGAPGDRGEANTPGSDNLSASGANSRRDELHSEGAGLHAGVTGGPGSRRISALSELPQSIAPPRELWSSIEATLRAETSRAVNGNAKRYKLTRLQVSALAAVVAALAVGVWIGRSVLPTNSGGVSAPSVTANNPQSQPLAAVPAAFVTDPRYVQQREALLRSHDVELAKLPPETRAKVAASLETIRKSMKDIETALGRDPSNALLQELLVNSYQDEMRVLTTVQEAGAREI